MVQRTDGSRRCVYRKPKLGRVRAHGKGLIINVTSLAGRAGIPFLAPYCAAKFAVEGLTEALYPFIRVNLIEPGGASTKFSHLWASHPTYPPAADDVRQTMITGAEKAAPRQRVAEVILAATKDNSDRLLYAATDAVPALRMLRFCRIGSGASCGRKVLA